MCQSLEHQLQEADRRSKVLEDEKELMSLEMSSRSVTSLAVFTLSRSLPYPPLRAVVIGVKFGRIWCWAPAEVLFFVFVCAYIC